MTVGNFSLSPADVLSDALGKGYCGVHVEQGAPVLDRDLNLLGDIVFAAVRRALRTHVGDGTAASDDFLVTSNGDPLDLAIGAGTFLAGGLVVTLAANTTYKAQLANQPGTTTPALTALTPQTPGQPDPRTDIVGIDAWVDDIDETTDASLANPLDVGMRTSTRVAPRFVVRVFENAASLSAPPAGHVYVAIAKLSRPSGGATPVVTDLRNTRLVLSDMTRRISVIEQAFQPIISTVAPVHVLPGDTRLVQIAGRNLDFGGSTVMLGSTPGLVQTPTSPTLLNVSVPVDAVPGDNLQLSVKTSLGVAIAPVPFFIGTPPPPPSFVDKNGAIPQISPQHASMPQAPAKLQLTLNGLHFSGINRVAFNAPQVVYATLAGGDIPSVTDTAITVNVPQDLAGVTNIPMLITVSTDGVAGARATSDQFFRVDPPQILAPAWGPTGSQITTNPATNPVKQSRGNPVILTGTNFGTLATTSVRFKGSNTVLAQATDILSVSSATASQPLQTIQVRVPAALTVAAPGNLCAIVVIVQGVESNPSNDFLTVV